MPAQMVMHRPGVDRTSLRMFGHRITPNESCPITIKRGQSSRIRHGGEDVNDVPRDGEQKTLKIII